MNNHGVSTLIRLIVVVLALVVLLVLLVRAVGVVDDGRTGIECRLSQIELKLKGLPDQSINIAQEQYCVSTSLVFRENKIYRNNEDKEYKTLGEDAAEEIQREIAQLLRECKAKFTPEGAHKKGNTCAVCNELLFADNEDIQQITNFHNFMNMLTIDSRTITTGNTETFGKLYPPESMHSKTENYPNTIDISSGKKYYIYYWTDGKTDDIRFHNGDNLSRQCGYVY